MNDTDCDIKFIFTMCAFRTLSNSKDRDWYCTLAVVFYTFGHFFMITVNAGTVVLVPLYSAVVEPYGAYQQSDIVVYAQNSDEFLAQKRSEFKDAKDSRLLGKAGQGYFIPVNIGLPPQQVTKSKIQCPMLLSKMQSRYEDVVYIVCVFCYLWSYIYCRNSVISTEVSRTF